MTVSYTGFSVKSITMVAVPFLAPHTSASKWAAVPAMACCGEYKTKTLRENTDADGGLYAFLQFARCAPPIALPERLEVHLLYLYTASN